MVPNGQLKDAVHKVLLRNIVIHVGIIPDWIQILFYYLRLLLGFLALVGQKIALAEGIGESISIFCWQVFGAYQADVKFA